MEYIPIEPIEQETYVRKYEVSGEYFGIEETVILYAECTLSSEDDDTDGGYYYLRVSFSVGEDGPRVWIIGMTFGEESYTQGQIDEVMDRVVQQHVDSDYFLTHLRNAIEKEELWEKELWHRRKSKFHFDQDGQE